MMHDKITGELIQVQHFGVGFEFHINDLYGSFEEKFSQFNAGHIRYPGGAFGENYFDPTRPNATTTIFGQNALPISDYISFSQERGLKLIITLPTKRYSEAGGHEISELFAFIKSLLNGEYGQIDPKNLLIEIGNEFDIGDSTNTRKMFYQTQITAQEYASIAKSIIDYIATLLDPNDVEVAVQSGFAPNPFFTPHEFSGYRNNDYITHVIEHAYPESEDNFKNFEVRSQNALFQWETAIGFEPELYLSEWNIRNPHGDLRGDQSISYEELNEVGLSLGVEHTAAFASFMGVTHVYGVDMASVWPLEINTRNALGGTRDDEGLLLAGQFFASASDLLINKYLVDTTDVVKYSSGIDLYVYENDSEITVLFSNTGNPKDQWIDIDLSRLSSEHISIWIRSFQPTIERDGIIKDSILEINKQGRAIFIDGDIVGPHMSGFVTIVKNNETEQDIHILASSEGQLLIGGGGDDLLMGDVGTDELRGMNGSDKLTGGGGSDTAYGGTGQDQISLGSGDDNAFGDLGRDIIQGGKGFDTLYGLANADRISGGQDDDVIIGGRGHDEISGGKGDDIIFADLGSLEDVIRGNQRVLNKDGNGRDYVSGGSGNDIIFAGNKVDEIHGGKGDDEIHGGRGFDIIYGDNNNDTIFAGAGNDYVSGGKGRDEMYGGDGGDTFEFLEGDGIDWIKDFEYTDEIYLFDIAPGEVLIAEFEDYVLISYSESDRIYVSREGTDISGDDVFSAVELF